MSATFGVQVTDLNFGNVEVKNLEEKLNFNLSKVCFAKLHTPLGCHAPMPSSTLQSDDAYRLHASGVR